ncbi:CGP-CTERM sorting domain-containing protein [Palaeococcus ferrophilus]|uniref:CGP-CTERM sorting domain-containing protein n=1 Tax=Palaeococcus ferrophilus TaxID=83868 RepID=UPI00064FE31F|nr:CGP-CTERM sorting domain-containing protein [Palaeococcus ferrophilus]
MKRLLILPLLLILPFVSAGMTVEPYEDGYAVVSLEIPMEEYTTSVDLVLPPEYTDVFVVDENGNPLPYTLDGRSLHVEAAGAQVVNVTYTTPSLLEKEGDVWTLSINASSPVTVVLPEGAILVALSEAPLEMNENAITMPSGEVWVSYTFPTSNVEVGETPTTAEKGVCGPALIGLLAILPLAMRKSL